MATLIHLDPSPVRLSRSANLPPQSQVAEFSSRLKASSAPAMGSVSGGAVISAAVPSVVRASTSYPSYGTGASNVGGAPCGGGGAVGAMNQDLLNAQSQNQRIMAEQQQLQWLRLQQQRAGGAASSGITDVGSTGIGGSITGMNSDLVQSQADNAALLKVQIALQHENQVFSSVSNVLKTRHDTVKNSIGNIR